METNKDSLLQLREEISSLAIVAKFFLERELSHVANSLKKLPFEHRL
jgi:hypothetical protein